MVDRGYERANDEPTIGEIMREPVVRALMRADRVDAGQFEARLRLMAGGRANRRGEGRASEPDVLVRGGGRAPLPLLRAIVEHRCWG